MDEESGAARVSGAEPDADTSRALHRTIEAVRDGMGTLRFNIAIARITELTNHLTSAYPPGTAVPRQVAETLVLLLAPLAPHVAEEMWSRLGHPDSLAWQPFPVAEQRWLVDDTGLTVGVIASVTRSFCGACDRTRLTADGQIRNCLFAREESDLRTALREGADDQEIADRWRIATLSKLPGHGIDDPSFLQPSRPMSAIGG